VYIAYFLIVLPAGYEIRRLGYKVGIVTGHKYLTR
jgi:fucose permease